MDEIDSIKQAIAALEAQRPLLGDAVVDTALAPLREKLALLQPNPAAEQRKLVTVLFADLVGFTAMSEHMDPEDVREIVNAYFTRWTDCIEKHGGVVEKFIGDAVMAVFGLSMSREDEPESAIRAALEMRQALVELNKEVDQSWGQQLAMRVGIHTGTVIVSFLGERKGQDFVVVGDTVNLTSRLQSVAPSGGILISHDTFRHVRGRFDVQMLSPVKVKGKEEPVQVYLVIRARSRSFHNPTRGVEGVETPLVGRELELAQMKEALLTAIETHKTQVVMAVGEAGVGKSRLVAEFDHWMQQLPQAIHYLKGRASPAMQNIPYALLRDLFSFSFHIYDSDIPQVVQEKFENGIAELIFGSSPTSPGTSTLNSAVDGLQPESVMRAHFIGQLLGFRFENSPYLSGAPLDPQIFWNRALSYLVDTIKALASTGLVALLLEDVHWADDNSLEVLERILGRLPGESLLVVCTARPTFFEKKPAWGKQKVSGSAAITSIPLAPLSQQNSHHLVGEILRKVEDVPESLRDLIVNRAEGNPFYIEELIKMLIEEQVILKEDECWHVDPSHLVGLRIPPSLVEVLQARLDSLAQEERVLLQRASVLGRVFWDDAIRYMEKDQDDELQISPRLDAILKNLNARQMVFSRQASIFENTQEYYFNHALLRDVTYDNVLKRLRRVYHGFAAAWLEATTGQSQRSDEYAALIAEHYELANDRVRARAWYQRAADQAVETYANAEGIRCLTRCLELSPGGDLKGRYDALMKRTRLYDTLADRQAQKQDLQTLQALAEQLDEQETTGDHPKISRLVKVYLQWWHFHDAMRDLKASMDVTQRTISLAQSYGDTESEALGHLYQGATLWRQSDYPAAQESIRKAMALSQAAQLRWLEADCVRNLGIVQQYQGNLPESRAHYEEAILIYHETGGKRGESMVLNSLGSLLMEQGLYREALAYLERSLELKRMIGHRRAEHITLINIGLLSEKLGNLLDALGYFEQVQRFADETGDRELEIDSLNGLGTISLEMGNLEDAKKYLESAHNLASKVGDKVSECGALVSLTLLAHYLGRDEAAHLYGQQALTIARELNLADQQTNSLSAVAQAVLNQGRMDEAVEYYRQALEMAGKSSNVGVVIEIQAGLALAYLAQGLSNQALEVVEEILDRLNIAHQVGVEHPLRIPYTQLEGINGPFQVLLTCCRVLQATNDRLAEPLLSAAYHLLMEQSERLPAGPVQVSYLEMIPAHRELRRLYNQLKASQTEA